MRSHKMQISGAMTEYVIPYTGRQNFAIAMREGHTNASEQRHAWEKSPPLRPRHCKVDGEDLRGVVPSP